MLIAIITEQPPPALLNPLLERSQAFTAVGRALVGIIKIGRNLFRTTSPNSLDGLSFPTPEIDFAPMIIFFKRYIEGMSRGGSKRAAALQWRRDNLMPAGQTCQSITHLLPTPLGERRITAAATKNITPSAVTMAQ